MTGAAEHERRFALFGTEVRLLLSGAAGDRRDPRAALDAVQARLAHLHSVLTRFDPTSELSRLNANAGTAVAVSETMRDALAAALAAAELSGGLVDPTLLPCLERAGYAGSRVGIEPAGLAAALATAPPRRRAAEPHPGAAWRRIELDVAARRVHVPAGVRLDLGGSAKGMAVDVAARMLTAWPGFAIDAGGDIRLGGLFAAPRTVRVEHPLGGENACELTVTRGAVATSGLRSRIWRTDDGYAHHLIDPARGVPAWTGLIQATALAPTALEAETLAKSALLLGPRRGRELLSRRGGVLIEDGGEIVACGDLPIAATARVEVTA